MTTMNQCQLSRDGAQQVAWIESRGAKVGAMVEVKSDNGGLWTVDAVHEPALPREVVAENERNHRDHRKATDI